ncbi:LysR substrate-binding domain-containing protein [Rummeliibacillus suwonensis]|uniref:LysR substrate-binding domain-containing protein n=1 Tax=Rummeliibacillus suwonensis TaxID=1306154 RepID=UPI001FD30364|nr:LysR substrate-binding domain-containing protein [Rummeliibacillus suwonensis]
MHQLRYFQAIAQTKNYNHAANLLHVSQPALTKAIHKLEEELGVPLFNRIGRSIEISLYGEKFLEFVEEGLQSLDRGVQQLQSMKDPLQGTIRLAFLQSIGTTILPKILRKFKERYPDVQFDLQQCNSQRALELVENNEVDLCLATNFSRSFNQSNWVRIKNEQLYGYCSITHPFHKVKSLSIQDLRDEPFIGYKDYLLMQKQVMKWCHDAGFTPNIVFQGTDVPTMAGLISANLGIGILPYYSGLEALPIHRFEIADIHCEREVGLAWKADAILSASTQLFIEFTSSNYE